MRYVSLREIEPGTKLGKTIYDENGMALLKKGTALISNYIRGLENIGYTSVYIDDELTYDIEIDDFIPDTLKVKTIKEIKNTFQAVKNNNGIQKLLSQDTSKKINDVVNSLLGEMSGDNLFNLNMGSIVSKDTALYTHCLNVGIYSTIIASAAGLEKKLVRDICVGAFLHDIGKILISDNILNKPGELDADEREEIKKHPMMGYDILRKQAGFSLISAHCALQHHEKYDGTGYPRGLLGNDIHVVGRIIAVADVFDAIVTVRPYKKPILPSEAIEMLYANSGTHFDPQFVTLFRDSIAIYPVGVTVRLSDNSVGIVVKNSKGGSRQKPTVRIFRNNGVNVAPYDFDLSTSNSVTITELYSGSA